MMVKAKILKAARVLATGMATAGSLALAGAAFAADGRLEKMAAQAIDLGERAGARLQAGMTVLPPPDTTDEIRRAATDFIGHAIGKMVPVAALLMAVMPKQE